MSIRDHYPEGTDLSYFDGDNEIEVDEKCPECGVKSSQTAYASEWYRYSRTVCLVDAECPECGHIWNAEWEEEDDPF